MATQYEMRQYVYDAYPGRKWQERVNKMTNAQIFATYRRLQTLPKKDKK